MPALLEYVVVVTFSVCQIKDGALTLTYHAPQSFTLILSVAKDSSNLFSEPALNWVPCEFDPFPPAAAGMVLDPKQRFPPTKGLTTFRLPLEWRLSWFISDPSGIQRVA